METWTGLAFWLNPPSNCVKRDSQLESEFETLQSAYGSTLIVAAPSVPSLRLSPGLLVTVLLGVAFMMVIFILTTRALARSQTGVGKILRLAIPERRSLFTATLFLLLGTVCQMPLVWMFGKFINLVTDQLRTGGDLPMGELQEMGLMLLVCIVGGSFLSAASTFLFSLAGEKITRRLRADFFRALLIQDMSFLDRHQSGEWLNRLAADAGTVQAAASTNLAMFLNGFAQFAGGVLVCLVTSWKLFLIIFTVIPLMVFLAIHVGRRLRRLSKEYQSSLAKAGTIAGETFGNVRTIRAFAHGETKQLEKYMSELDVAFSRGRHRAQIGAILGVMMSMLVQLSIVAALIAGGTMVIQGMHHKGSGMQAGTLASFIMYALWAAGAVSSLVGLYNSMSQAVGASERVFEVLEHKPSIPSTLCESNELPLEPCEGRVDFENVYFAYSSSPPSREGNARLAHGNSSEPLVSNGDTAEVPFVSQKDILRGMSFSVEAGCVAALVGPSGGGKSTVMALIMRLYDPRDGVVRLDGQDLKALDLRWLRNQLGVVSQEPVLFASSIRDNINYGLLEPASDASMEDAARRANAHDFVSELSESYDTLCGEKGIRLSGGEKQRVAIARALLLKPRLLLMDEATSALDAESERLVQEAMDLLLQKDKNRPTVFMIAHRLSTVQSANVILVVEAGRIREWGPHDKLMKENGLYAKLAMNQRLDEAPRHLGA